MGTTNSVRSADVPMFSRFSEDTRWNELHQANRSERRQGRLIDNDSEASMERKKREGYF